MAARKDDKMLQAIIKWIPVEVITIYNLIMAPIPMNNLGTRMWLTVAVVPITGLWIAFATHAKTIAWRQVLIAPFAFICWTASMQTSMLSKVFPGWEDWMGQLALGAGTLLLPIVDGALKRLGVPQD